MGVTITILKRIPSYKLKIKINKGRHRSPVEEEKEAPCRRRIVEEVVGEAVAVAVEVSGSKAKQTISGKST